jgi:hypothetical protein
VGRGGGRGVEIGNMGQGHPICSDTPDPVHMNKGGSTMMILTAVRSGLVFCTYVTNSRFIGIGPGRGVSDGNRFLIARAKLRMETALRLFDYLLATWHSRRHFHLDETTNMLHGV